jgi:hypothetical protein
MVKSKLTIGRSDLIDLPELGLENVKAKIDTGAYTSAIHCSKIKVKMEEGKEVVSFYIPGAKNQHTQTKFFKTHQFTRKNIKSSNGTVELRVVIKTKVKLFNKSFTTEFSLTDRSKMKFPVLLGRKLLKKGFVVDVTQTNLSFKKKNLEI